MAPPRADSDLHVETDALHEYSRKIYGQSGGFEDSWLGKPDWAGAATYAEGKMNGEVAANEAARSMESPLEAGRMFWQTHGYRVDQTSQFTGRLALSLQAIAAASGAIVHAYESSDQVNAADISSTTGYFRGEHDAGPGTLERARRDAQRRAEQQDRPDG